MIKKICKLQDIDLAFDIPIFYQCPRCGEKHEIWMYEHPNTYTPNSYRIICNRCELKHIPLNEYFKYSDRTQRSGTGLNFYNYEEAIQDWNEHCVNYFRKKYFMRSVLAVGSLTVLSPILFGLTSMPFMLVATWGFIFGYDSIMNLYLKIKNRLILREFQSKLNIDMSEDNFLTNLNKINQDIRTNCTHIKDLTLVNQIRVCCQLIDKLIHYMNDNPSKIKLLSGINLQHERLQSITTILVTNQQHESTIDEEMRISINNIINDMVDIYQHDVNKILNNAKIDIQSQLKVFEQITQEYKDYISK